MPTLEREEIKTLEAYTKLIQGRVRDAGNILWYRGSGDYDAYKLEPSLFRHSKKDIIELLKLEKQLMTRFQQRGYPFIQKPLGDDWEKLFFMQHYGLPTRLLDWSESPFVALYFALDSAKKNKDNFHERDVAVWVVDPTKWNRFLYPRQGDKIDILTASNDDLDLLKQYGPTDNYNNLVQGLPPVALYGTHNSPRIVSQRGVFTISGYSTTPMEELYENHKGLNKDSKPVDFPQGLLLKIKIPATKIEDLKGELKAIGLTHSVIYPDLEGLAKEIRLFFGYSS